MLNYGNEKIFAGKTDEEKESIKREIILSSIESKKKLIDHKRNKLDTINYEINLITQDIANTVREDMVANAELNLFVNTPVADASAFLNDTWLEKSSANKEVYGNFSEEIKKRCKANAATTLEVINRKIIGDNPDFKFLDIGKGDEGDYYWLEYEYKNVIAYFGLPVYSKATPRNVGGLLDGYIVGHTKAGENRATFIAKNYNYKSLVSIFLKWYSTEAAQNENPDPADKSASKKKKGAAK